PNSRVQQIDDKGESCFVATTSEMSQPSSTLSTSPSSDPARKRKYTKSFQVVAWLPPETTSQPPKTSLEHEASVKASRRHILITILSNPSRKVALDFADMSK